MPVISFSMEEHSRLVLNNPLTNISSHSHFMGKEMINNCLCMETKISSASTANST